MKLLRVKIMSADSCGGLLDTLDCWTRSPYDEYQAFDPLCLIGPNGAGKSQFLQALTEIFQSLLHACCPEEERIEGNPALHFELEYKIRTAESAVPVHIKALRAAAGGKKPSLTIQRKEGMNWIPLDFQEAQAHLPVKVVGYTSGDNETLSLPFFISRSGYADAVGTRALNRETKKLPIPDTRLMLIDYTTHLEVLVANLLLGDEVQRDALLQEAHLKDIRSFRCIIQLAHSAAPKAPRNAATSRKGIQLTDELESYIDNFRRCATCYDYDERTESYTFDFWVNEQTRAAFRHFWAQTLDLYTSFHKLAMLNDLVISRDARRRFRTEIRNHSGRRFATRLPEPQDEDKAFRFDRVTFLSDPSDNEVDYVSLSDGEHQLGQLLGAFSMLSSPNVLFLLDEPESHFNPAWRVKFISRLLSLPTQDGPRANSASRSAEQECLLTTHAPFVPSDMRRERVFIFSKDEGRIKVRHPNMETFGTTFDNILEDCFGVAPPISQLPREEINQLMESNDPQEIRSGLDRLGDSIEKVVVADRLRRLRQDAE